MNNDWTVERTEGGGRFGSLVDVGLGGNGIDNRRTGAGGPVDGFFAPGEIGLSAGAPPAPPPEPVCNLVNPALEAGEVGTGKTLLDCLLAPIPMPMLHLALFGVFSCSPCPPPVITESSATGSG